MNRLCALLVVACRFVSLVASVTNLTAALPTPAPGWRLELLAQAPDVLHPGTVACSPDGRIFVAEDPMDIRTERADLAEGRIVCFHPDGRRSLFVDKVYAAFGLQYFDGRLYVLHNPYLSVWDDAGTHGTNRVDLVTNTNPNWHALGWNDHVPANFRLGLDGRFYVATGDKGLFGARDREGKRFDFFGGGIFRLRPDGTELESFSTGIRNIMDVALDAEDNAFTFDNTDEHEWMGRLTYMVDGGFYGYPHDFIPQRPFTLWCFGDFGAGAATAVGCSLDDALPPDWRGNLFLADFGKRNVLRVKTAPADGAFAVVGTNGPVRGVAGIGDVQPMFTDIPEDFRPVGLTFTPDGRSLLIGDWQHRDSKDTNAYVGRLWKLSWTGSERGTPPPSWYVPAATGMPFQASTGELLAGLRHPSKDVRHCAQRRLVERTAAAADSETVPQLVALASDSMAEAWPRIHALWALDAILRTAQPTQINEGSIAETLVKLIADQNPIVAGQAMRRAGEAFAVQAIPPLLARVTDADPTLRFRASTSLGRIKAVEAVNRLSDALADESMWPRYAAFTALNRIGRAHADAWPAIVERLANPNPRIAQGARFALRTTYELELVRALMSFRADRSQPLIARVTATELLADICRQPPAWTGDWWAYHPFRMPPPTHTVDWDGTPLIRSQLVSALSDSEPEVRRTVVRGLAAVPDTSVDAGLQTRLKQETDIGVRAELFEALGARRDQNIIPDVVEVLRSVNSDPALVQAALAAAGNIRGEAMTRAVVEWLQGREASANLKLQLIGIRSAAELRAEAAVPLLAKWANSTNRELNQAAIAALGKIGDDSARTALLRLLAQPDTETRKSALGALAKLPGAVAVPEMLAVWRDPDLRAEALLALARTPDLRAVDAYLEGLASKNTEQRAASRRALDAIQLTARPLVEARMSQMPSEVISELQEIFKDDPAAQSGPIFAVRREELTPEAYLDFALSNSGDATKGEKLFRDPAGLNCIGCHRLEGVGADVGPDLSNMGAQFGPRELAESILWPSKVVREGYQSILVELKDGEEVEGLIKGESADLLTLRDSAGGLRQIPKADIAGRRQSNQSLMPEELHAGLTLQEFADLIAFASRCRQKN